jgi:predicted acyl esterase
VMISARDGVKLHTVILVPKGARRRCPYFRPHALRNLRS